MPGLDRDNMIFCFKHFIKYSVKNLKYKQNFKRQNFFRISNRF